MIVGIDLDNTIIYRLKALKIYREIGEERFISDSAFSVGHVYLDIGKYSKSLKYFKIAKSHFESANIKHMMARLYNRLGAAYFDLGEYEEAERYMKKDLSLHQEIDFEFGRVLGNAHLLACRMKSGKSINTKQLKDDLKKFKPSDLPYRDNYILSEILNDTSYLITAYEQVMGAVSDINETLKNKFLAYHYPKMIIKKHNSLNK